jgi:hypothetical protein
MCQDQGEQRAETEEGEFDRRDRQRRPFESIGPPSSEPTAQPEPEHEGGEHRSHGVVRAAEGEGELSSPLEFEDKRR